MSEHCLLYYITDRRAFPGDETARRRRLLEKIAEAARCGVDYVQLREKDLPARELEELAREAVNVVRNPSQRKTALLINSRTDVALAAQANGVHLRADDILPSEVRKIWSCGAGTPFDKLRAHPELAEGAGSAREISPQEPVIGVSCHSVGEVSQAARNKADFAVFGPVFEKKDAPSNRGAGLATLAEACRNKIPVLALGGITLDNARACLDAGAAGIAAIRLFQESDISEVIVKLRH
jgi:thiamine-phosphate pyrophosphorylase